MIDEEYKDYTCRSCKRGTCCITASMYLVSVWSVGRIIYHPDIAALLITPGTCFRNDITDSLQFISYDR